MIDVKEASPRLADLSLAVRIALAMAVLVLVTSTVSISMIFRRINTLLIETKTADLEREAELQGVRFVSEIEEMQRDVLFLAGVPPMQGLIRADRENDPEEQAAWEGRLEIIFTELLRSKPDYLQARYIGVADGGREIVRVDRATPGAEPRPVPREARQRKGDREYMLDTLALADGELYLSALDLNQEHGEIVTPWQPVIRAATPVFDEDGQVYGIVIINHDMQRGLDELARVVDPDHAYYLVNADGHYLAHSDPARTFTFDFDRPPVAFEDFPVLQKELDSAPCVHNEVMVREGEEQLISIRTLLFGPSTSPRPIGIVVADSIDDVTTVSARTWQQLSLVILWMLVLAVGAGVWLARWISEPIRTLTEAIADEEDTVPQDLPGEAGLLASVINQAWTRQRQHAEALAASNRELEQFAYITSHDLQEPLRTISSFAEALQADFGPQLGEEGQAYTDFIVRSCIQMRNLIHGLLEYSRLDAVADRTQRIDTQVLVTSVAADLESAIRASGAELRFSGLPDVRGNAIELRMLFLNLLSNAIKYRHPDRAPLVQIEVCLEKKRWHFTITDNGIGILPEHRERIFRIFQRLHTQDQINGTGIGLALCKKIVDLHRGQLRVDEGNMGGAAFHFDLEDAS